MSYIEKFWRNATAADVARVMAGEVVEARFTQHNGSTIKSFIAGWKETPSQWMDSHGLFWDYCQVYAPEQWYIDKPEPGEGYRLLGKFPDEEKLPTDEYFADKEWWVCKTLDGKQIPDAWYRRKIEQPKPEPKYAVGQRVKIIGPKARPAPIWEQAMDRYIGEIGTVKAFDGLSFGFMHQVDIAVGWNFHQDYLEPVVEPEPKHYVLQVGDTAETPAGYLITITDRGYSAKAP